MDISSIFKVAFNALLRNRSRSLLTTLGIIIGVAAVILLVSIGKGLQEYVTGQFESIGSNTVYVMPFDATDSEGQFSGPQGPASSTIKGFSKADLRTVERIGFPIESATPIIEKLVEVSYKGETDTKTINAASADYQDIRSFDVISGRFYTASEDEKNRRVVVLGSEAAQSLFNGEYPIGKTVTVSSVKFKVVGVLEPVGSIGIGPNIDDEVYIPLNAGLNLFNVDVFDFIAVKVRSADDIALAKARIEAALSTRRDNDEFSVFDQTQLLSTITNILSVITAGIGGIGAISLLVGGIGIMNIMLVSVTERTREIGLRKAVGATPRAILIQFLIEAVLLSVVGGLIGIVIGLIGSRLINAVFPSVVSSDSVFLAFFVSAGVGILFGFLPARRAAKLSPIDALEFEG